MSEKLRALIEEWNGMQNAPKDANFNFDRYDRELKVLQEAIRKCYEKEESSLTEEEKMEVANITNIDLTYFG